MSERSEQLRPVVGEVWTFEGLNGHLEAPRQARTVPWEVAINIRDGLGGSEPDVFVRLRGFEMSHPREGMPPGDKNAGSDRRSGTGIVGRTTANRGLHRFWRLRRMKRRFLRTIGRSEARVKIPLYQTAELRMIPTQDLSRLEPMMFDCPICSERDGVETKLLMLELQTTARDRKTPRKVDRSRHPPVKMLLRITRPQFDDLRGEFAKPHRGPRKPKSDRERVLDRLVP